MKKLLFASLFAFVLSLGFTSCGEDPVAKVNKLAEKVEKEANDMTEEDCAAMLKEMAEIESAFYASNPTEEQYNAYKEATDKFGKAVAAAGDGKFFLKVLQVQMDLMKNDADFKKKLEDIDVAEKAFKKPAAEKAEKVEEPAEAPADSTAKE